uniref:BZIP domain-containing protein n=1 Tax=Oryza punctata TaxID=4537 RepID=A0A0E0LXQ3_ORYPU
MERAGGSGSVGDDDYLVLPPASSQDGLDLCRPLPSSRYSGGGGAVASLEQELLDRAELHQQQHDAAGGGADRRKRRAMKNRESAERSRARKQAYLQELEQEVRLLRAENAALRDQCHELKAAAAEAEEAAAAAAAAAKKKKKPTIQRTSSATF